MPSISMSISISAWPQCQFQYSLNINVNVNVNVNVNINVNININISLPSGAYSVLQVVFILQRNTGYFLIQVKISWYSFSNVKLVFCVWWGKGKWNGNLFKVYVPCTLIVVLSWVSFGLFINIFQTKLSFIFF